MEKCSPDYAVRRTEFSYVAIEFVVSGRARVSIGSEAFDLRPGSLFGYMPNTALTIENSGVYPLTKYFVNVYGAVARKLFEESPLGGLQVLDFSGVRWVEETFRQLVKFGARGGVKAERSCRLLAELLLMQVEETEGEQEGPMSAARQSYQKCRSLIEAKFATMKSIAELSAEVSLDQAYIARLFGRFDDETPFKKLTRLKMNQAARLLLRENLMVKNAAGAVGYDDAAHFSRVFKQTYGVSPARFALSVNRGV